SPLPPDAGGLAVPTGASARLLLPGAGDVVAAARVEGEQPFLHQQAERLRGRLPRGPVPGDQVRDRRGRLPVRDLAAGDEAADIVRDLPVPARVAPVCTPTGALTAGPRRCLTYVSVFTWRVRAGVRRVPLAHLAWS